MTIGEDLRLHHIGVLVRDIPASLGFYEKAGYIVESGLIHDPVQTAYVQFLRLPSDSVYVELISPDGESSKLSRASTAGGGIHHWCYSTTEMARCIEHLRGSGLVLVAEPVPAVAFQGRQIAWLGGRDRILIEVVERGPEGSL